MEIVSHDEMMTRNKTKNNRDSHEDDRDYEGKDCKCEYIDSRNEYRENGSTENIDDIDNDKNPKSRMEKFNDMLKNILLDLEIKYKEHIYPYEVSVPEKDIRYVLDSHDDINLFGKIKYLSKDTGLSVRIGRNIKGERCYIFYEKTSENDNKGQYHDYRNAIAPHIDFLREGIAAAKDGNIRIRVTDIAKAMEMTGKHETSIYWGLKYALFAEGLVVTAGLSTDNEPVLIMRERRGDDVLRRKS